MLRSSKNPLFSRDSWGMSDLSGCDLVGNSVDFWTF